MRVTVTHTLRDFESDQKRVATRAQRDMSNTVRKALRVGNEAARYHAKRTAGAHGKHYHKAFSWEMTGPLSGEYGPDIAKPQGGMSFERGSRNQPPHLDIARSADAIGPAFAKKVSEAADGWFWS